MKILLFITKKKKKKTGSKEVIIVIDIIKIIYKFLYIINLNQFFETDKHLLCLIDCFTI